MRDSALVEHAGFLIIVAKQGRSIADGARRVAARSHPPGLPFVPTRHVCWRDEPSDVVVGAWQADGRGPCRWSVTEAGISMTTGDLRWRGQPWTPEASWAVLVRAASQLASLRGVADDLVGSFTLLRCDRVGSGAVVTDPLGLRSLFATETREAWFVATTAGLAAWAAAPEGPPPLDALAASRLAFSRFAIGSATGFAGVRLLAPGTGLELDPARGPRLVARPDPWLPTCADLDLTHEEHVERVEHELVDSLQAYAARPGPRLVDLTGGKDSRLLLALALSEGLAGRFHYRTLGPRGLLDVEIAVELADWLGLDHLVAFPPIVDVVPRWMDQSHAFVRATDGLVNLWESRAAGVGPRPIRLSGIAGELLRSPTPLRRVPATMTEVVAHHRCRLSRLHLLHPDVEAQLTEAAMRDLCRDPTGSRAPLDAADGFALRNNRHRLGLLDGISPEECIRPMCSAPAIRSAFALGPEARHAEMLHYRIIHAVSPALADHRLTGHSWDHPALAAMGGLATTRGRGVAYAGASDDLGPPSGPADDPAIVSEGVVAYLHRTATDGRTQAIAEILADVTNPAWDLIQRHQVIEGFSRFDQLTRSGQQELYGALTAAMWLERRERGVTG